MRFWTREIADPRPELTPLVDVVFQLIIYFAVSTTFAYMGAMKVKLPRAGAPELSARIAKLAIVIRTDGQSCSEGQPVTDEEIQSRLENLASTSPDTLIVIQADKNVAHGRVVTILDMAQAAGLSRLAIATERKFSEESGGKAERSKMEAEDER
jgi:biopolymer transport protein ExbD